MCRGERLTLLGKLVNFLELKPHEIEIVLMVNPQAVMMAGERVLLSLKSGDIYLVTLFRYIQSSSFSKTELIFDPQNLFLDCLKFDCHLSAVMECVV